MPRTRQQVHEELPLRQHRAAGDGVAVTQDDIQRFLTAYEGLDRAEGTVQFYRRKLLRFYWDLPEDKIIRQDSLKKWQKEVAEGWVYAGIGECLCLSGKCLLGLHRALCLISNQEMSPNRSSCRACSTPLEIR